jgi:hypothetical protein
LAKFAPTSLYSSRRPRDTHDFPLLALILQSSSVTQLSCHAAESRWAGETVIELHGMLDSTCPGVQAFITNGYCCSHDADTSAAQLYDAAMAYGLRWNVSVPGIGGAECSLKGSVYCPHPPAHAQSRVYITQQVPLLICTHCFQCVLSGSTNVNGRFLNGVDPHSVCSLYASAPTSVFVHIEQTRDVRDEGIVWAPVHLPQMVVLGVGLARYVASLLHYACLR